MSNTFKVDLHALHVDEAVAEMEKTIQDLSRFKCKHHLLLQCWVLIFYNIVCLSEGAMVSPHAR